jgi:hypothetical protein
MAKQHKFTDAEIKFIRDYAYGHTRENIRQAFNEKFNTELTYTQIANVMKRHNITNGIDSRFKKGQVPHNKGKKMSPEVYEKVKGTLFQKGHDMNARPVGSERIDKDGYTMIKVGYPNKWRLKHLVIWESFYGKVPDNHVVIFLDGDIRNFDIDNLKLITRGENLFLNRKKLRFNDRGLTESAVNVAKLNSKIYERKDD